MHLEKNHLHPVYHWFICVCTYASAYAFAPRYRDPPKKKQYIRSNIRVF